MQKEDESDDVIIMGSWRPPQNRSFKRKRFVPETRSPSLGAEKPEKKHQRNLVGDEESDFYRTLTLGSNRNRSDQQQEECRITFFCEVCNDNISKEEEQAHMAQCFMSSTLITLPDMSISYLKVTSGIGS